MQEGVTLADELVAGDEQPPQSRTEWVLARLRDEILAGVLEPGAKLLAKDLTARYGVSATPLREAIPRLAAEGLVRLMPQHGAAVAPLTVREVRELFEIRLELEPMAVGKSVSSLTDAQLSEIRSLLARNHQLGSRRNRNDEYWMAHRQLHAVVRANCDSNWLARMVGMLVSHCERYQRLRAEPGLVHHEHSELWQACERRDAMAASESTRQEIANTRAAVISAVAGRDGADPAPAGSWTAE